MGCSLLRSLSLIVHNPFIACVMFIISCSLCILMEDTFMFLLVTLVLMSVLSLHRLSFLPNGSCSDNGKRMLTSEQESLDSAGVF